MPWVESSPFRNWVEWTWVDLEKCQVQGRQHIDFDPSPFDPIRPQSIRPKLFDQKGRPNSFRPISFDPFHAIQSKNPPPVRVFSTTNNRRDLKLGTHMQGPNTHTPAKLQGHSPIITPFTPHMCSIQGH